MLRSNRARAFEREKKGRGLPQSFFSKSDRNSSYFEASSIAAGLYLISCSNPSKSGEEKKSKIVISNPSQIFFTVETVVELLRPETMLLSVDCVMPQMVDSLFKVIVFCRQSSKIEDSPLFQCS